MSKKIKSLSFLTVLLCIFNFFLICSLSYAKSNKKTKEKEFFLSNEINYLFNFLKKNTKEIKLEKDKIYNFLNFVNEQKDDSAFYYGSEKNKGRSTYYEVDINKDINSILSYFTNFEIPDCIFSPSTTRFGYWVSFEDDKNAERYKNITSLLDNNKKDVVIKGIYLKETTPNLETSSYYSYLMDMIIIGFKNREQKYLVTISKLKDSPAVGKIGYVIGEDNNWDYYYTNRKGMGKTGLKWIKPYIYSFYKIEVLSQKDKNKTRYSLFTWMRAGWSSLNMVTRENSYNGSQKFGSLLKQILESDKLLAPSHLQEDLRKIKTLSQEEKKQKVQAYLYSLSKKVKSKKIIKKLKSEGYLNSLDKKEIDAILFIDYIKKVTLNI